MNLCGRAVIFLENEDDQKSVCSAVFDSHGMDLTDMGLIPEEEGFKGRCRSSAGAPQEPQSSASRNWPEIPYVEDRCHGDFGAGIKGKRDMVLYLFQRIDPSLHRSAWM